MKTIYRSIVAAALVFSLASCAAIDPQVRMEPGDEACLLFGYIDMTDSGDTLEKVVLTQDEKIGIIDRQSSMKTYADGLFFLQDLPPMSYVIPRFYAGGNTYGLPHEDEDAHILEPGSLTYVGAMKYQSLEKGCPIETCRFSRLRASIS